MQAVIGTPDGDSYQVELDEQQEQAVIGLQVGEEFDGSSVGLSGYTLKVTGGSDEDGFPMRETIQGTGRRKILLTNETGGKNLRDGERKRTSVRGNTVSAAIEQLNVKVVEEGSDTVEDLLFGTDDEEPEEDEE